MKRDLPEKERIIIRIDPFSEGKQKFSLPLGVIGRQCPIIRLFLDLFATVFTLSIRTP